MSFDFHHCTCINIFLWDMIFQFQQSKSCAIHLDLLVLVDHMNVNLSNFLIMKKSLLYHKISGVQHKEITLEADGKLIYALEPAQCQQTIKYLHSVTSTRKKTTYYQKRRQHTRSTPILP